MIPMTLHDVAPAVGATLRPDGEPVRILGVTTDSRRVRPGDLFFAIVGERFDGHRFIAEAASKGAVACVCSRDRFGEGGTGDMSAAPAAAPCLAVGDTVEALTRLAAHYRRHVMHDATVVVAVTGSNGKTTTKCMIDHVLSGPFKGRAAPGSFNNHIGVPLTLLSAERDDHYLVVEIGSNAPGEVEALSAIASPDVAVITSIGEAHLEGLESIDGVAAEKASLLRHVRPDGLAVVNVDRPEIRPHLGAAQRAELLTVGTDASADLRITGVHGDIGNTRFELDGGYSVELSMPGVHHAVNAAAAFAVARRFGVGAEEIVGRLRSFTPPEGRTRRLQIGGLTVVDDAYNANPASMTAAVGTLRQGAPGRCVLVMGDMLELGPQSASLHHRAVGAVLEAGIEVLVAVGATMTNALRLLDGCHRGTRVVSCADAGAASDALMTILAPGDTVWVKGSRAMGLDRVVSDLQTRFGNHEPQALACADMRKS
ncbi:MAG: UDP-N-acetylmuramoyl-tripeptide--D-alanyl-D-alanine ligase [Phycisphaerales bacterium]|nr:MAG: UDP-N-acetylmuramoyl-tripeptide--D-alanyl-D-alanine ligase [Phycisphaerales bacterium]